MGERLSIEDAVELWRQQRLTPTDAGFDEALFEACEEVILTHPLSGPVHASALAHSVADALEAIGDDQRLDAMDRLAEWLQSPNGPAASPC